MLLTMCKSCQYCLESFYWSCCEERCCFDEKIASYRFEDVDTNWQNGYVNMGASLDSIVTTQPANNNHLPQEAIGAGVPIPVGRETKEMPVHADKIYEVFSKSMIFKEDQESKSNGSSENLDDIETKSEPDYLSEKPNRTKVYFEDEINSPITDFEIMFKDELLGIDKTGMCKIEEEEENDDSKTDDEGGLVMNVDVKMPGHDLFKPSTITIKDQTKITTPNPIFEYDPSRSVSNLPSTLAIPRVETVKGILRVNKDFPRSHSAKNLTRMESNSALKLPPSKLTLTRVESLKNIESKNLNKVLARVPHRSASFLNLPDHLLPEHKVLRKTDSAFAIGSKPDSKFGQLSHLPDTPIIRSTNLPRFFAESPALGEYKGETSLQSIKDRTDGILMENDYSMPRYYGKVPMPIDPIPVHESKSMPDLRIPSSSGKVSKRLVKMRSRLKPLVIKKGTDEKV